MTANRLLAKQRGLTEEAIQQIDYLHDKIAELTAAWIKDTFRPSRKDEIHEMEFLLQQAWGFPQDRGYHTYANEYKFKCEWIGRTFRCNETGEEFTIPDTVKERDYFVVGNGAVDVGRLDSYSRVIGSVVEV